MLKTTIKLMIFASVSFLFSGSDASAVARLATCQFGQSIAGGATDGSNCDAGLMCDPSLKICVSPSETACSSSFPCSIGMRCVGSTGNTIDSTTTGVNGTCQFAAGGTESNAFGDLFCNAYSFITGKVGRGLFLVAVVVTGVTFFMGKIQFTTLVVTACGVGFVFGAPAIVSVFVGKGFVC